MALDWAGARRDLRFPDLRLMVNFVAAGLNPFMTASRRALRVVDVGACCGGWTLAMLERLPNAAFECFEPWPGAWPYLEHNLAGVAATVHRLAASDADGTLALAADPENLGKTSAYNDGEKQPVGAVRLDGYLAGAVDLLKIDAEGHELAVLRGAAGLLAGGRTVVIVELLVEQQQKAGLAVDAVPRWLAAHGYGAPVRISGNDWLFMPERR